MIVALLDEAEPATKVFATISKVQSVETIALLLAVLLRGLLANKLN